MASIRKRTWNSRGVERSAWVLWTIPPRWNAAFKNLRNEEGGRCLLRHRLFMRSSRASTLRPAPA